MERLMTRVDPRRSAGWAAFAWAVIFAPISLYWAAGGLFGGETLGVDIDRLAHERDASFVAGLWASFVLKALAATLALAFVEPWGRRLPRRLLLVLGGATGAGITLYAVANLVQHALMATGAIGTPDALGRDALAWHLALWDPFWLVGGLLFLLAAAPLRAARCPPRVEAEVPPATDDRSANAPASHPKGPGVTNHDTMKIALRGVEAAGSPAQAGRRRALILFAAAVAALALAGCTSGDGRRTAQTREIANFTRIDNRDSVDVRLYVGEPQRVRVSAGEKVIDDVLTDVRDGTLRLTFDHDGFGSSDVIVEVAVPDLTGIEASGSGDIDADGIDADAFEVRSDGSADIALEGAVGRLAVSLDGSGDADLAGLAAREARVVVGGSGGVDVRAHERLEVQIDGSGDVRYHGDPELTQRIDGSGELTRAG